MPQTDGFNTIHIASTRSNIVVRVDQTIRSDQVRSDQNGVNLIY